MTYQSKDFSTENSLQEVSNVAMDVRPGYGLYRTFFKRALDLAAVIATAPIVVPFMVLLASCVALDGHNPFFKQKRIGRDGREFTMWKLRTMVPDAERRLGEHLKANKAANFEWKNKQKLSDDPRITRFGRILRKTSLDELPQLWSVFVGDMSLVGPRPIMVNQRDIYPGVAYYRLRPGITGYWQISDRNKSSFAARATFDNQYAQDVRLGVDIKVLISTVGVVLRGTGC